MTSFLAWVYAQASKVYDWFGNTYYSLRNAAANAWNWAVQQAQNALSAAQNYAYHLLQQGLSGVSQAISWITQQFANLRNDVFEDLSNLYDWVTYRLSLVADLSLDAIWNTIENVRNFVTEQIQVVRDYIQTSIQWAVNGINNTYRWLLVLNDDLQEIVDYFNTPGTFPLLDTLTRNANLILAFLAKPIEFILDIIQEKFVSFLCYVLAWALGTTKYDLPRNPPWKGR